MSAEAGRGAGAGTGAAPAAARGARGLLRALLLGLSIGVLTYQIESGEAAVVTHRVVQVVSSSDGMRSFVLRGDANGSVDADPVMPVQVKGAVWYSLPLVGWVAQAVDGEGRGWVATAVGAALCLYSVVALAVGVRRRRRARHARH